MSLKNPVIKELLGSYNLTLRQRELIINLAHDISKLKSRLNYHKIYHKAFYGFLSDKDCDSVELVFNSINLNKIMLNKRYSIEERKNIRDNIRSFFILLTLTCKSNNKPEQKIKTNQKN